MRPVAPHVVRMGAVLLAAFGTARAEDARIPVGSVPVRVAESRDLGPADGDLPFSRVILLLKPRDPAALETFLERQQDPTCPDFHRWLTPREFGARFGAAAEDVERVSAWLSTHGLTVIGPNEGRTVILFSGRLADVARALQTEFRNVDWNGEPHVSNATVPSLPRELAGAVGGIVALDDFRRARPRARAPLQTSPNGVHSLAPADFAAIYDLGPLYSSGVDGRGTTIVIPGGSEIIRANVDAFRNMFGLSPIDLSVVVEGPDPGTAGDVLEGYLDVEWAGAVAPGARIVFIVSATPLPAANPDLAALAAVDRNLGDVLSYSYGWCEADSTPEYLAYYRNLWAQAAAQGISVVVASGDTGLQGCALDRGPHSTDVSVEGLASTPYVTGVGGTLFDDTLNPSDFWSAANDPVTLRSVKGPIPEVAWQSSGGGLSSVYARPAWQEVPGLAPGPNRGLPDVAFSASAHVPYLIFAEGKVMGVGGTSASTPAFAGMVALLDQRLGGRQGNLNPMLYALGRAQYGAGGPAAFRDVTVGNNSRGGLTGYSAGPGYDLVTGLGSVNASAFVNAWASMVPLGATPADFAVGVSPATAGLPAGGSVDVTLELTTADARASVATLAVTGLPAGWTATFAPSKQEDGATGYVSAGVPATLRLAAPAAVPAGSYTLLVRAAVGTLTRVAALVVAVGVPPDTAPGVELQAPVVLDVFGSGHSHFTSDLFALNRSGSAATLLLRYVATPGTAGSGAPLVAVPLPAGTQFRTDDLIAFLRSSGVALPTGGGEIGTLFAAFAGVSDPSLVSAGSRTSTPNPNAAVGGSFGTFSFAWPSGSGIATETWVYGLREDGAFRSNLAVVHSPSSSSFAAGAPIGLEIQLYDGDRGVAAGDAIAATLQPGEFRQFNSVLAQRGLSNGYARVRRTSGSDRFIAYGVVNDGPATGGGTSDGSLIPAGATEGLLPIVLDLPGSTHYLTDLTLTNPSLAAPAAVTLTYTPAALFGAAGGGTVTTTLAPGRQLQVSNAVGFLRGLGLPIPIDGKQGGTLLVSGAAALARTFNPNPDDTVGGTFGLAYPAVPASRRATTGAWVYGLRQDDAMRSNLAIADARRAGGPIDYRIDVFSSTAGSSTPAQSLTRTLGPGQWTQVDAVLQGAGISQGYARVAPGSGTSDYVAYGVTNDGPGPGTHTSDGSYLPMVVER